MPVLNNREAKRILDRVDEQWGVESSFLLKTFSLVLSEKQKVYLINREIHSIDSSELSISSVGLYFANVKDAEVRLSIEGSQLIGPHATKNVFEITRDQVEDWIRGRDLETTQALSGYVIVRCDKDFIGCGHFKDGIITNFVPKNRRISSDS